MDSLELAIQEIIEKKTLSLEGVDAVTKLREDNKLLSEAKIRNEKTIKEDHENLIIKQNQIHEFLRNEQKVEEREKAVTERETKQTKLECEVDKYKMVSEAYWNITNAVFRNTVVKQDLFKNVPGAEYGGTESSNTTETKE